MRAPAVYGPGDRETLAYFRAVNSGIAPQPRVPEARLSLIHVADLAEALALPSSDRPRAGPTKSTTAGPIPMPTWRRRPARRWGRRPLRLAVPRSVMAGIARWNEVRQSLGGGRRF